MRMLRPCCPVLRCAATLAALALAPGCAEEAGPSPTAVAPDGTVSLAPAYARATPTVYEHTMRSRDRSEVPISGVIEVSAEVMRRFRVEVLEARDDGSALVRFRMLAMRFHIEPSTQPAYDFDSETNPGAEDDRIAEALRGLASLSFEAEMAPDGSVASLPTFGDALRELRQPPTRVESFFDREWFIAALENVWQVVEDDPRRTVGTSWQTTADSTLPEGSAEAVTTFTHTLSAVEDGLATIEGSGDLVIEWGTDPRTRGTQSRIDEQGYTFKTVWSLARGNLESMEVDSMIRYFVNFGGGLDQRVDRWLVSALRRVEASPG